MRTLFLAALALAAPARADPTADAPPSAAFGTAPALTLSGVASLVSDYRFRGVSRSDRDAAAQASLRVDTRSGVYAAAWASTVSGRDTRGASAEADVYAGWTRTRGGWTPDVGVYAYLLPGGRGQDFYEVYAALTRDLGPLSGTVGVNYAPDVRGQDNGYVYTALAVAVPNTPLTLKAGAGYEDGALAREKLDWYVGASVTRGHLALGARYVDSDANTPAARAGAVLTLTASFP